MINEYLDIDEEKIPEEWKENEHAIKSFLLIVVAGICLYATTFSQFFYFLVGIFLYLSYSESKKYHVEGEEKSEE